MNPHFMFLFDRLISKLKNEIDTSKLERTSTIYLMIYIANMSILSKTQHILDFS